MDELVTWVRQQIQLRREVAEDWPDTLTPVPEGSAFWVDTSGRPIAEPRLDALAQCDSHDRLLDFLLGMNDEAEEVGAVVPSLGEKYRERFEHGVKLLALSYRHCDGYQQDWTPAGP